MQNQAPDSAHGISRKASPQQQPAGTDQTIIRKSPRSARPQRRSGTPKRRRVRPHGSRQAETRERRPNAPTASISAFLGTSAEVTRGTGRNAPQADGRHQNNVRNNARGTRRRRQFRPRQRNPAAAAVTGNRPASPGGIADQRHGLNPGHDERQFPRRCITALSPTAALQSVPGTSAARRRVKPRTQPAGSTAGRHLRQQPAGTDKTIIGSRHDQPVRSDAAEPQNAEGQGLSGSRPAETRG